MPKKGIVNPRHCRGCYVRSRSTRVTPATPRRSPACTCQKAIPRRGPKFDYKLAWFERMIIRAADLIASGEKVVLAGDFNVPNQLDADRLPPQRPGRRHGAGLRLALANLEQRRKAG